MMKISLLVLVVLVELVYSRSLLDKLTLRLDDSKDCVDAMKPCTAHKDCCNYPNLGCHKLYENYPEMVCRGVGIPGKLASPASPPSPSIKKTA